MDRLRQQAGLTSQQWEKIEQVVQTEFNKARVAAKFLQEYKGKIEPSDRTVPAEEVVVDKGTIDDVKRIRLVEISTTFTVTKQQLAAEGLSSAIVLFRRAANALARLEDAIIFNGQPGPDKPPTGINLPPRIKVLGGEANGGLLRTDVRFDPQKSLNKQPILRTSGCDPVAGYGNKLVKAITQVVSHLDGESYLPPYSLVLDNELFTEAHNPTNSMVMPIDRISPLVEGRFSKSGVLPQRRALLVSLAGDPVDLAVAVRATPQVYKVHDANTFELGVYESFVLRLKEAEAAVRLEFEP